MTQIIWEIFILCKLCFLTTGKSECRSGIMYKKLSWWCYLEVTFTSKSCDYVITSLHLCFCETSQFLCSFTTNPSFLILARSGGTQYKSQMLIHLHTWRCSCFPGPILSSFPSSEGTFREKQASHRPLVLFSRVRLPPWQGSPSHFQICISDRINFGWVGYSTLKTGRKNIVKWKLVAAKRWWNVTLLRKSFFLGRI